MRSLAFISGTNFCEMASNVLTESLNVSLKSISRSSCYPQSHKSSWTVCGVASFLFPAYVDRFCKFSFQTGHHQSVLNPVRIHQTALLRFSERFFLPISVLLVNNHVLLISFIIIEMQSLFNFQIVHRVVYATDRKIWIFRDSGKDNFYAAGKKNRPSRHQNMQGDQSCCCHISSQYAKRRDHPTIDAERSPINDDSVFNVTSGYTR